MKKESHNILEMLTISDVAMMINRSVETVRRLKKTKKLSPKFIDRRGARSTSYWSVDQVKAFLEANDDYGRKRRKV